MASASCSVSSDDVTQLTSLPTEIVVIGPKRSGKSSAANTILRRDAFSSGNSTKTCDVVQGEVAGRQVVVVDTPGWSHVSTDRIEEGEKREIARSPKLCRGQCKFLLVISVGQSFTQTNLTSFNEHMKLLGKRVWEETWLLFTHGDKLGDSTIEQYIQKHMHIQTLIHKCKNRCHVFNNMNKGDSSQVIELLDKIDKPAREDSGKSRKRRQSPSQDRPNFSESKGF